MTITPIRRTIILIVILAQVAVLGGIALLQGARIANGAKVVVAVTPIDPLDVARGYFVNLDYGLGDFTVNQAQNDDGYAYLRLTEPAAGSEVWRADRVIKKSELKTGERWLRLPVHNNKFDTSNISTWYTDRENAQRLEIVLAKGNGVAVLSLDTDGSPNIVKVREKRSKAV